MRRKATRAAALLMSLALGACDFYYNTLPSPDDAVKLVPWFDHMIKSPAVHPYESASVPRNTVPGTVPITRTERDWSTEWNAANYAVADRITNPTDPALTMARGDTLYQIYCAVCHGQTGNADGPVSARVGAPPVVSDRARAFSDGYLYSLVRYGRGVMPRYGDKVTEPDARWAIVNYVRKLQADAQAATSAGGTP